MKTIKFEGIVIGYENWRDVDRLISFYTPLQGKIEAVAKGVRHEKSKLKGHLEILTHGEFMLTKNNGRGVLTDAISRETFSLVRKDPVLAYVGAAIAEMYGTYLFPHAADLALWDVLMATLTQLCHSCPRSQSRVDSGGNSGPWTPDRVRGDIADFAKKFLQHLGYFDSAPTYYDRRKSGQNEHMPRDRMRVPDADDFRTYDTLLAHTEIAGPTFSGIERGLKQFGY